MECQSCQRPEAPTRLAAPAQQRPIEEEREEQERAAEHAHEHGAAAGGDGVAHNRQLEWRQLDERSVEVATKLGPDQLQVLFEFDTHGDIVRAAAERPWLEGKTWVPTPWAGEFGDYKMLSGIRLPTSAEVHWELPAGRFVYWRGTVTSAELLDAPFPLGSA